MAGEEDDRKYRASCGKRPLESEAIAPHHDIKHKAARRIWIVLTKKFFGRPEDGNSEVIGTQETRERIAYGCLVIDNKYGRTGGNSHQWLGSILRAWLFVGRLKWKVAPPSALFVTQMLPRCALTMLRQTESPSPIPLAFVVKKGSNTCSILSSGMMPPRSVTDTRTAPFSSPEVMSNWRSEESKSAIASQPFSTRLSRTC